MKKLLVYDTTLRDGEQAPGNHMSLDQKTQLFQVIDALGVDYIDVGFPASSQLDFAACKYFAGTQRNATISALARANKKDLATTIKAFNNNEKVQMQILLLGSEIHVKNKRRISINEAIGEAAIAIDYAKNQGIGDISVALEDASRAGIGYLKTIIEASIQHGATTIVLPDTVGAMIPEEIYELICFVRKWVGNDIKISIHCHNDMGLATANTLAAIKAGVDCIQTTLCGIGERAGNAAIEEVLTVLKYKSAYYRVNYNVDLKKLHEACAALINTINLTIGTHKPIIGKNAFATAAGIHIHGLLKDPIVYEFVRPNDFNQRQNIFISRHAGKSAIRSKLETLKLDYDDELIKTLCERIKTSKNAAIYNNDETFITLYRECSNQIIS